MTLPRLRLLQTLGRAMISALSLLPAAALAQMDLRHHVAGGAIDVRMGALDSLRFDGRFRHVGAQRFVLGAVADAEQHLFVDADSSGNIRAFYWLQFETMLPTASGRYEYAATTLRDIRGLPMYKQARRYEGPPPPDGDRGHAWLLLERAHLRPPVLASRMRFILLPDSARRSEVMIIFVEPASSTGPLAADEEARLLQRALQGFEVVLNRP